MQVPKPILLHWVQMYSAKRILPSRRNASRVHDFLSPEKFSQLLYRLPESCWEGSLVESLL